MKRGWILVAAAAALVACNKSDGGTGPAASTAPAESAIPAATASAATAVATAAAAAAAQPTLDDHGNVMDPTLPSPHDSEDTSDITASTYKKALDGLDKEVAGLK